MGEVQHQPGLCEDLCNLCRQVRVEWRLCNVSDWHGKAAGAYWAALVACAFLGSNAGDFQKHMTHAMTGRY